MESKTDASQPLFNVNVSGQNNHVNINQNANNGAAASKSEGDKDDEEEDFPIIMAVEVENGSWLIPEHLLPKNIKLINGDFAKKRLAYKQYLPDPPPTRPGLDDTKDDDTSHDPELKDMEGRLRVLHHKMTSIGRRRFNRDVIKNVSADASYKINDKSPKTITDVREAIKTAGRNCVDPLSFVKNFHLYFYFTGPSSYFLNHTIPGEINQLGKTSKLPFMIRPPENRNKTHCAIQIAIGAANDARKCFNAALESSGIGISFKTKCLKESEIKISTKLQGEMNPQTNLVINTDIHPQFKGRGGEYFYFETLREMLLSQDVTRHISDLVRVAHRKNVTEECVVRLVREAFDSNDRDELLRNVDGLLHGENECDGNEYLQQKKGTVPSIKPAQMGSHHGMMQQQPQASSMQHSQTPFSYQPLASSMQYQQMDSRQGMAQPFDNQPQASSMQNPQMDSRQGMMHRQGMMQPFDNQTQASSMQHPQMPFSYPHQNVPHQQMPPSHQHQNVPTPQKQKNHQDDSVSPLSRDSSKAFDKALDDLGVQTVKGSPGSGNFAVLVKRSGKPEQEEKPVVASPNQVSDESYDSKTHGIITHILEKKKQGKSWIYLVRWKPCPQTGDKFPDDWRHRSYLLKSFKELLLEFDEKEKSKLAKVLCPCLSMLFDFGTAHIMVSYC